MFTTDFEVILPNLIFDLNFVQKHNMEECTQVITLISIMYILCKTIKSNNRPKSFLSVSVCVNDARCTLYVELSAMQHVPF